MEKTKITQLVMEVIENVLMSQDVKGKEKYGKYLDSVAFDDYDWQRMALEEMADGLKYVVMENARLKVDVKRLEHILKEHQEEDEDDEDELRYEVTARYKLNGSRTGVHYSEATGLDELANVIKYIYGSYHVLELDIEQIDEDDDRRNRIFEID